MPIFHKNRQNLQSAKTDKSQQILQGQTTETHSIFCQDLENAVEPKTKKSAFSATKKSTPINKKHAQKNLTSTQALTPQAPRKKFLKIFAAVSLALITCATTLLATAPFGTGAASAAAAESEMTAQEKLAAGTLNLNPDTDPTIYTTESGLEIKFGGATLESGGLSGFTYFTMGEFTGTDKVTRPINWVIIGKSTSGFNTGLNLFSFFQELVEEGPAIPQDTVSAAGTAIQNDIFTPSDTVVGGALNTSSLEKTTEEIPPGCVLVLSEDTFEQTIFMSTQVASAAGYSSNYISDYSCETGELRVLIDSYCKENNGTFSSTLGFTQSEMRLIQKQFLKTAWRNPDKVVEQTIIPAYLFPMASYTCREGNYRADAVSEYTSQNYLVETYLDAYRDVASSKAISSSTKAWWLRTGAYTSIASSSMTNHAYHMRYDGTVYVQEVNLVSSAPYARPAFVMKLA